MYSRLRRLAPLVPLGLVLVFIAVGAYLVRTSESSPALTWMHIYAPEDFVGASLSDILAFFLRLMIPIPPVIGLAEIISIQLAGSPVLVTRYAYQAALVGSFAAAIWLARTSLKRVVAAFLVSILFLHVTLKVHIGNPQNYDMFFPLFFLLFLLALERASQTGSQILMPVLAGLFLSMTELTRPFVIYLIPLLVAGGLIALSQSGGRRQFLPFILPVLLLSGGWHAYLFAAHGQITFSNNAGFNVARVWPQIPAVGLVEEPDYAPLAPDRWANLNTAEHGENSRRAQQAQLQYWISHPLDTVLHSAARLAELLRGDTAFGGFVAESHWFGIYAILVRLLSSFFILAAALIAGRACLEPRRAPLLLARTDNLLILVTMACALLLAVGEIREEPRLLLSLLPMFAAIPAYRPPQVDSADSNALQLHTTW